jgi:hypothetical protein
VRVLRFCSILGVSENATFSKNVPLQTLNVGMEQDVSVAEQQLHPPVERTGLTGPSVVRVHPGTPIACVV